MKIGVVGKPGSGKTTFANELSKFLPSSYVPNVDEMYARAKSKMQDVIGWRYYCEDEELKGESIAFVLEELKKEGIIVDEVDDLDEKVKLGLSKLVFKYISDEIERTSSNKNEFVIVDFYMLANLEEFYPCDYIYLVHVDEKTRYERIISRIEKYIGRKLTEEEKNKKYEEIKWFEEEKKVDYNSFNELANANKDATELAKEKAKTILRLYSKDALNKMVLNEIKSVMEYKEDQTRSIFTPKNKTKTKMIKELKEKIIFLYEEGLIDKDCYKGLLKEQRKI